MIKTHHLNGSEGAQQFVLSLDGELTAGVFPDRTVRLWKTHAGDEIGPVKSLKIWKSEDTPVDKFVTLSPDGRRLVLLLGASYEIYEIYDKAPSKLISRKSVPSDGRLLASAFGPKSDAVVYSWQNDLPLPSSGVSAAGVDKSTTYVWNLETGRRLITHVAVSADGQWFATGSDAKIIRLGTLTEIDTKQTQAAGELDPLKGQPSGRITGLLFSPDSRKLAAVSEDRTVKIWNVGSGQTSATLPASSQPILCMAFSLNGKCLVTGGGNGELKVWDITTTKPTEIRANDGIGADIHCVLFRKDGMEFVSVDQKGDVRYWEAPHRP
jgi:WD40 repeat protein